MTQTETLSANDRVEISRPAIRAFFQATADWRLSPQEELALAGCPIKSEFDAWRIALLEKQPLCLGENRLLRIGAITRIHRAISRLLPQRDDRITWLRQPSRGPSCRGEAPVAIMITASDHEIIEFRQRVDAWTSRPVLSGLHVRRLSSAP